MGDLADFSDLSKVDWVYVYENKEDVLKALDSLKKDLKRISDKINSIIGGNLQEKFKVEIGKLRANLIVCLDEILHIADKIRNAETTYDVIKSI